MPSALPEKGTGLRKDGSNICGMKEEWANLDAVMAHLLEKGANFVIMSSQLKA